MYLSLHIGKCVSILLNGYKRIKEIEAEFREFKLALLADPKRLSAGEDVDKEPCSWCYPQDHRFELRFKVQQSWRGEVYRHVRSSRQGPDGHMGRQRDHNWNRSHQQWGLGWTETPETGVLCLFIPDTHKMMDQCGQSPSQSQVIFSLFMGSMWKSYTLSCLVCSISSRSHFSYYSLNKPMCSYGSNLLW